MLSSKCVGVTSKYVLKMKSMVENFLLTISFNQSGEKNCTITWRTYDFQKCKKIDKYNIYE